MTEAQAKIIPRVILSVGAALVVLTIVGMVLRGWIRGTLGVAYAQRYHAQSVDTHFAAGLAELKPIFKAQGILLDEMAAPTVCRVHAYQNIHATYRCEDHNNSHFQSFPLTPALREQWEQAAPTMNEQLRGAGWSAEQEDPQAPKPSLTALLEPTGYLDLPTYLTYYKTDLDHTRCTLTLFAYGQGYDTLQVTSQLLCQKDIKFFGGYTFEH
jgi:hypothetical protein